MVATFEVSLQFDNKEYSFKVKSNEAVTERIVFGPFKFNESTTNFEVTFKQNGSPINNSVQAKQFQNSYLLYCAAQVNQDGYLSSDVCYPIFGHSHFVRCRCIADFDGFQLRFLPIILLCCVLWLIAFWVSTVARNRLEITGEPEQQHLMIMCQMRTSRYQVPLNGTTCDLIKYSWLFYF